MVTTRTRGGPRSRRAMSSNTAPSRACSAIHQSICTENRNDVLNTEPPCLLLGQTLPHLQQSVVQYRQHWSAAERSTSASSCAPVVDSPPGTAARPSESASRIWAASWSLSSAIRRQLSSYLHPPVQAHPQYISVNKFVN